MNREEAKELLPIIQAFAEGKKIEYSNDGEYWIETETPTWNTDYVYRIKPEPKYRPFNTQEECWQEMHKHPNFGWGITKEQHIYIRLNRITENHIDGWRADEALDKFTFTDGKPFGIKEE